MNVNLWRRHLFLFFNFFYFKISIKINFLSSVCSLQEQLRHLYPRLKVLAFGAKPESTLHTYLPSFLSRATSNCPADMKKEVREGLHKQPQSKSIITVFFCTFKTPVTLLCLTAAQQHDRVSVCGCTESGSVEATLHQTFTPVQVSHSVLMLHWMCSFKKQNLIFTVFRQLMILKLTVFCFSFFFLSFQSAVETSTKVLEKSASQGGTPATLTCCWKMVL